MPASNDGLIAELRKLADRILSSPGVSADVTVRDGFGDSVTLTLGLPRARQEAAPAGEDDGEPDDQDRAILDVLADTRDALTAKEIAEEAGIDYGSTFRKRMARLVDAGQVENCNPGYRLKKPVKTTE